jgi:hypothetical protein
LTYERKNVYNVRFGSNNFINTDGVIAFDDSGKLKQLLKYEIDPNSKPLVTVEIRDSNNALLGKVYKASSFVVVHPDYDGKIVRQGSDVKTMALLRKSDGAVMFELLIHAPNNIEVNGIFHIEGYPYPIIASRNGLEVGRGNRLSGCTIAKNGTGIVLSKNGFAI